MRSVRVGLTAATATISLAVPAWLLPAQALPETSAQEGVSGQSGAIVAAEVRYSIHQLVPPEGLQYAATEGIADDGTVVGESQQQDGSLQTSPVLWAPDGTPTNLQSQLPADVSGGAAHGISDDGRHIVGSGGPPDCGGPQGGCKWVLDDGQLSPIDNLETVRAINNTGIVVGSTAPDPPEFTCDVAARWANGVVEVMEPRGNCGNPRTAVDINNDNEIAAEGRRGPAVWSGATVRPLDPQWDGTLCPAHPTAINDAHQVAGYRERITNELGQDCTGWWLTLWRPGGHEYVNTGGLAFLGAADINDQGQMVIDHFLIDDDTVYDLNDLIDPASGWEIKRASDINDAGQIIGGGVHDGVIGGFRLDPLTSEPDANTIAGPLGRVTTTTARFDFTGSTASASFLCSLDGATPQACSAPQSFTRLGQGAHSFTVTAVDGGQVETTPSTSHFVINSVRVSRVHENPAGTDDAQNRNREWVAFRNRGDRDLSLRGWTLSDNEGHHYVFPRFSLPSGQQVRIHSGAGVNDSDDLYWDAGRHVWNNDEDIVWLYRRSGLVAERCRYHPYPSTERIDSTDCLPQADTIYR